MYYYVFDFNYQDMILIFNSQPRMVSERISKLFAYQASSLTRVTPQNDKSSRHSLLGTTSQFVRNQLDLSQSFYLIFELSWILTVLRCKIASHFLCNWFPILTVGVSWCIFQHNTIMDSCAWLHEASHIAVKQFPLLISIVHSLAEHLAVNRRKFTQILSL